MNVKTGFREMVSEVVDQIEISGIYGLIEGFWKEADENKNSWKK